MGEQKPHKHGDTEHEHNGGDHRHVHNGDVENAYEPKKTPKQPKGAR